MESPKPRKEPGIIITPATESSPAQDEGQSSLQGAQISEDTRREELIPYATLEVMPEQDKDEDGPDEQPSEQPVAERPQPAVNRVEAVERLIKIQKKLKRSNASKTNYKTLKREHAMHIKRAAQLKRQMNKLK